jgi:hypothetical protein
LLARWTHNDDKPLQGGSKINRLSNAHDDPLGFKLCISEHITLKYRVSSAFLVPGSLFDADAGESVRRRQQPKLAMLR